MGQGRQGRFPSRGGWLPRYVSDTAVSLWREAWEHAEKKGLTSFSGLKSQPGVGGGGTSGYFAFPSMSSKCILAALSRNPEAALPVSRDQCWIEEALKLYLAWPMKMAGEGESMGVREHGSVGVWERGDRFGVASLGRRWASKANSGVLVGKYFSQSHNSLP